MSATGEKRISFNHSDELGSGCFGKVYRGRYLTENNVHLDVAVKVIDMAMYTTERDHQWEIDAMRKADHENVLKLYAVEYDSDFRGFPLGYLALELCAGTLTDYFTGEMTLCLGNDGEMYRSVETKILRQITLGMEHVHECGYVHKDLKSDNILVQIRGSGQFTVKLADFGLVRRIEGGIVQPDCHNTGNDSTKAPERSEDSRAYGTRSMDIFSLGIIFHQVLTKGVHPFDINGKDRIDNIQNGTYSLERLLEGGMHDAVYLIRHMVSRNRSERPTAWQVLQHPLVWTNGQRRSFAKRWKERTVEVSDEAQLDKEALQSLKICLWLFDTVDAAYLNFNPVDCGLSSSPLHYLAKTFVKTVRYRNPYHALENFEKYIPCFAFFMWLTTSDPRDHKTSSSLHEAVELNQVEQIQAILEDKEMDTINQLNPAGETPLHVACKVASLEVVQLLLTRGARLDVHEREGYTPLHRAVLRRDIDIIRLLVDAGARLEATDNYQHTPLHLAALKNIPDVVELLLDRGAEVNAGGRYVETPLHLAAESGCEENIDVLIKFGARVDAVASSGQTPLFSAARSSNANTVRCLVEKGASVNLQNKKGETALHHIIYCDREDLVGTLLEFQPDVNLQNNTGDTPLHAAARLGHENIMQLLIQAGADPEITDDEGKTAAVVLEEENRAFNEMKDSIPDDVWISHGWLYVDNLPVKFTKTRLSNRSFKMPIMLLKINCANSSYLARKPIDKLLL